MKKQVTGVILGLAAFFASLNVNANDGWNGGDYCDPCCGDGGGLLGGFTVGAQGLYLWACEDVGFASTVRGVFTESGTAPEITSLTLNSEYNRFHFKNRLGYEVWVAYASPCSCWGLKADYFHFNTNARGHAFALGAGNGFFDFLIPENSAIVPDSLTEFGYTFGAARLKLQVNMVDLNVERFFCINDCFEFAPSAGVRWLNLEHRSASFFTTPEEAVLAVEDFVDVRNKHDSVGLRAGFTSRWNFCGGFAIYGELDASVLCGHDRQQYNELQTRVTTADEDSFFVNTRHRHHRAQWVGKTTLGIEWATTFCSNQTLRLKLGWEYLAFLNVNQFDRPQLTVNALVPAASAVNSRSSRNSDLVLQGFVFGAEYTF